MFLFQHQPTSAPLADTTEKTPLLTTVPSETNLNPPIEPTVVPPPVTTNVISPPTPINLSTTTVGSINEGFINSEAKQTLGDINQAAMTQGVPTIPTFNPAAMSQPTPAGQPGSSSPTQPMLYNPMVSIPSQIPTFSAGYHVPNQPNPYSMSSRGNEHATAVSFTQPTLVFDPALAAKSAQELLGKKTWFVFSFFILG